MEVLDLSHNFFNLTALIAVFCAGKPPRGRAQPGFMEDPLLFENVSMLMHVDASHNPIFDVESRLGWAVGRACRLVNLNLSYCRISAGLADFADGYTGGGAGFLASTTLRFLNLAGNELKDDAVLPRWRRLAKRSWLDRLERHVSLVQIDMRGNQLRNEAALRVIRALHVLQKRATKLGRNVTGAYPTCELILDDNVICMELQRAIFCGGSNEIKDSLHWLREYHRQRKEAIWMARKQAMREFAKKALYNTKALLLYAWQSKPSLWLRFQVVRFFTGEPPVWWVQAQEAQKRKAMQLEKLVRMMEDQEDAALARRGVVREDRGEQENPRGGID